MKIEETNLEGLSVITSDILEDNRGFFAELYRKDLFEERGINVNFVQQNVSVSGKRVIRALHFQWDKPLGKFIRVTDGRVLAVAADIRKNSSTLGKWFGIELGKDNRKAMYAPPGFAFGFCVLDDPAEVQYLYTALRNANAESSILWNDPTIEIKWPIKDPILSEKDASAQTFEEWMRRPEADYFR
ncbi:MAG: dTDP-4-dehydrorhamnose 3,5-epimerase [Patescibacteria group bacterium]